MIYHCAYRMSDYLETVQGERTLRLIIESDGHNLVWVLGLHGIRELRTALQSGTEFKNLNLYGSPSNLDGQGKYRLMVEQGPAFTVVILDHPNQRRLIRELNDILDKQ